MHVKQKRTLNCPEYLPLTAALNFGKVFKHAWGAREKKKIYVGKKA